MHKLPAQEAREAAAVAHFATSSPEADTASSGQTAGEEPAASPRLFVDVQLATPYGVSSHLLIPACKLGKTGDTGKGGAASPAWASTQATLSFVYKGLGIGQSDPPDILPKELAINLGSQLALDTGDKVTLKMKLGGGASGTLKDLEVAVTKDNYNAKTHVLKIAGGDLKNLTEELFKQVGPQFGPEAINPPTAITVAETTLVIRATPVNLNNALAINWIKAPR
jgi:hypothetical protein